MLGLQDQGAGGRSAHLGRRKCEPGKGHTGSITVTGYPSSNSNREMTASSSLLGFFEVI